MGPYLGSQEIVVYGPHDNGVAVCWESRRTLPKTRASRCSSMDQGPKPVIHTGLRVVNEQNLL